MKSCSVRDSFCVRFLAPKRADHETKRNRLFHLVVRGFVVQKVAAILVPHHRPVGCSKSCSWFILHREMREARETRCEMREARKDIRDKEKQQTYQKRQKSLRGTALSENAKCWSNVARKAARVSSCIASCEKQEKRDARCEKQEKRYETHFLKTQNCGATLGQYRVPSTEY